MRVGLFVGALLGLIVVQVAAAEEPLFPFVVSYDAPPNATSVAAWLPRPAGQGGFVRVKDGRLVNDAGPIRFWATNFCFEASFPAHDVAEKVAARLARLGINCVRLHHMDSHSIWGKSPNKLTIDPEKLERLDYLIAQFKRHGVYVDINLHVSRWFGPAEGFEAQQQRPNYDKGLDNFEPRMIELQKKYARDLLAHENPYTKSTYANEPAVACVEINNENALFAEWNWGNLDNLPPPYSTTFAKLWNSYLRAKYGTTARLAAAWQSGRQPLGAELLANGELSMPLGKWYLESDDKANGLAPVADGPNGRPGLRIKVEKREKIAWRPQFMQAGVGVKKDGAYTLTFFARADAPRTIGVNCMQAHEPWERVGFAVRAKVGKEWKPFKFTFIVDRDDANVRITFTELGLGSVDLAQVSFRPGGVAGLEENQKLEDDSVPIVRHSELSLTASARRDWVDFLWETEQRYWTEMYRFLKDDLKVRSIVSGTQLSYSPAHVQAQLDYIDAHSYWHHPHFPGRPWDMNNWTVANGALVNSPKGTIAGLAARRVAGMAYTVSEYNHPQPNQYTGEGFPMIAAYGGLQQWDAIFTFAYCHNDKFEPQKIGSFFDILGDTPKMVHSAACAALFLRGDVAPAQKFVAAPVDRQAEREQLYRSQSPWTISAEHFGLDPRLCLVHGISMDLKPAAGNAAKLPALSENTRSFVSDTGQLRWDVSQEGAGFFTADTPRTKVFTGFVAGRKFDLGNVQLAIGPTRLDWATVSLVCLDGSGFDRPGRVLLAATGLVQNSDMHLEKLPGNQVTLGNRWGREPVLCEGVPLEVTLPVAAGRVTCYPLDPRGDRRAAVAATPAGDKALLKLGPQQQTVWYELEIK